MADELEVERVYYEGRDEWLRLRRMDVTASVAAALVTHRGKSAHQYTTREQLIAEKRGGKVEPENGLMWRGRIYEAAVASAIRDLRPEWDARWCKRYVRAPLFRCGATPDMTAKLEQPEGRARRRTATLQLKTANPASFSRYYEDNRAPLYARVQVAVEAMLLRTDTAFVVCLEIEPYGRPRVSFCEVPRSERFERYILKQHRAFWDEIDPGWEPVRLSRPRRVVTLDDLVPEDANAAEDPELDDLLPEETVEVGAEHVEGELARRVIEEVPRPNDAPDTLNITLLADAFERARPHLLRTYGVKRIGLKKWLVLHCGRDIDDELPAQHVRDLERYLVAVASGKAA